MTYNDQAGRAYGVIPVGVAALMNNLRAHGIQVKGISYPLERQINPAFDLDLWMKSNPAARVVLIDLHWYEHCFGALDTARAVRRALPDAWIILGGLSASGFAAEILRDFPEVDLIVRGDAEKPLLDLVERILSSGKSPVEGLPLRDIANISCREGADVVENDLAYTAGCEELDALDFTDLSFLEHYRDDYVHEYIVTDVNAALKALETRPFWGRWLSTARGCRSECSYCGGGKSAHRMLAGRHGLGERSAKRVVDDLVSLKQAGVMQASMAYDIANMGDEYWHDLFAEIKTRKVKIGIYNEFFQLPKAEFFNEFVESVDLAHSCVAFSPLSGNERTRRLNGKHYSTEAFFDILAHVSQFNLHIFVYFSLNLPGETEDSFHETLNLARQIYEFYPSSLLQIFNTVHTVDPFSPMGRFPEKYGIKTSMVSFQDYYNYCYDTRMAGDSARTEIHRGFTLDDIGARRLDRMADAWDAEFQGKETAWRPIPAKW
ncbi:MAG TPA: radical SAM protein [Anaerolinea sp.]|nr:radical SAM protein [Anaerolinea sp.]